MVAWYKKDTDLLPASHTNIENVNNRGGGGREGRKQGEEGTTL